MNKQILQVLKSARRYSQKVNNDLVVQYLEGPHEGIVTFGLNRSQQKNAVSVNLLKDLTENVDRLVYENEARVLVIHSLVPGTFCAGADLKERAGMAPKEVNNFVKGIRGLVKKIFNIPFPTITALDGIALGGGLEIALASDIRIAASNAKMGLVETKLAIMPGAGGTQFLPRIINPSLAKELIFTARTIDGASAEKLGLVNKIAQQNDDGNAAYLMSLKMAEEILANGPLGVRMAKQAINRGIQVDLSTGLAIEEACYAQLIPTKDRSEGLTAFKEKRKPVYTGQ
ncbi:unnamed protein product [Phaedon cochleariae]|uniref:Uncharacterized protein n=1 Tax=Phaedon cochleariae TaxID=80249 RepID=A0A9P0DSF9_PHACE|nr:unnamed protein product [Phaedon cochleariae]